MLRCSDFAKHALHLELFPKQAAILDEFFQPGKSHAVWALGRRSGKTLMAAIACIYMCFVLEEQYRRKVRKGERWYVVTVANSQDQARIALNNIRQLIIESPFA
ncbi:terminase, partial [bacterium]|nr:terminase [bacterium]